MHQWNFPIYVNLGTEVLQLFYILAYLWKNLGEVWFKKIKRRSKINKIKQCALCKCRSDRIRERVQLSYSCLTFVVNSLKKGRGTTFWNLPRFLLSHKLFRTEAHTARLLTYLLSIGELTVFQDNFWLKSLLEWSRMNVLKRIWCQMLQENTLKLSQTDVNSYTVFENL